MPHAEIHACGSAVPYERRPLRISDAAAPAPHRHLPRGESRNVIKLVSATDGRRKQAASRSTDAIAPAILVEHQQISAARLSVLGGNWRCSGSAADRTVRGGPSAS